MVVSDGGLVDAPLEVIAPTGDLAIRGLRTRATAPGLFEAMIFAHCAPNVQVAADLTLGENEGDLLVDLGALRSLVFAPASRLRNSACPSRAAAMFLRRRASWRSVSNELQTHTTGQPSPDGGVARQTDQRSRGPSASMV